MISPEYCQMMARYNAWQNKDLRRIVETLDEEALTQDYGLFFGSLMGTMNHLLWGDMLWMSRFDGGDGPEVEASENTRLTPNAAEWARLRFLTDGRIREWALGLNAVDLIGDITWYSGMTGQELTRPITTCVTHFFNHQTHHRGQIHAIMTRTGQRPTDTDLVFMPDED